VAEVLAHLLRNPEAMSSSPSIKGGRRKGGRERKRRGEKKRR
jgi:hypothetical protein